MPCQNLFIDTNVIVDCIIPFRRTKYACSLKLMEKVGEVEQRDFRAWSTDYSLSEALGTLKDAKEERLGLKYIDKQVLSTYDIAQMVIIIDEFRKTPHFEVFEPEPIQQKEIFEKVKHVCIQAKDALVLLSALTLKNKPATANSVLVTRDDRLLIRASRVTDTAHPVDFLDACPLTCTSRSNCTYRK